MKKIKLALWIFPLFFSQAFGMQSLTEGEQLAIKLVENTNKQLVKDGVTTFAELEDFKRKSAETLRAFEQASKSGDKDSIEKSKKDFSNLIDHWVSLEDLLTS